jgi:hypothetical protein
MKSLSMNDLISELYLDTICFCDLRINDLAVYEEEGDRYIVRIKKIIITSNNVELFDEEYNKFMEGHPGDTLYKYEV